MSAAVVPEGTERRTSIRPFRPEDFGAVERIVEANASLDRHSAYSYFVNHLIFTPLFLVLECEGQVRGFAMAIGPNVRGQALFWQIGLAETHRGRGYGRRLALALIEAIGRQGGTKVFVTIAEDNLISRRLFERCAVLCNAWLATVGPIPRIADDIQAETLYEFSLEPKHK